MHLTLIRRGQARQCADRRRFSGPIQANQPENRSGGNIHGKAVEGLHLASEPLGYVMELNNVHRLSQIAEPLSLIDAAVFGTDFLNQKRTAPTVYITVSSGESSTVKKSANGTETRQRTSSI